jgi:hypothetical protein
MGNDGQRRRPEYPSDGYGDTPQYENERRHQLK